MSLIIAHKVIRSLVGITRELVLNFVILKVSILVFLIFIIIIIIKEEYKKKQLINFFLF